MELKHFSLSTTENNRLVKFIRIVFGILCIAVAAFWLSFNIKLLKADGTLWITIVFLSGFGFYQIWSGMGRATRYIEIGPDCIRLKKNPILAFIEMPALEIEKIENRIIPNERGILFKIKKKNTAPVRFHLL